MRSRIALAAGLSAALLIACASVSAEDPEKPVPVDESRGWPRDLKGPDATLTVYQPQVDSWKGYASLELKAAVGLTPKGAKKPVLGVLTLGAFTTTDFNDRSVVIYRQAIKDVRFPSAGLAEAGNRFGAHTTIPANNPRGRKTPNPCRNRR